MDPLACYCKIPHVCIFEATQTRTHHSISKCQRLPASKFFFSCCLALFGRFLPFKSTLFQCLSPLQFIISNLSSSSSGYSLLKIFHFKYWLNFGCENLRGRRGTMIKTLNPYSKTTKTAEIMSRYRPIAPKPEVPANSTNESSDMSQKIRQSPYLRNLWPQLQARPTRTRKRGRAALSPPPTLKRARTHVLGLSSPSPVTSPAKNLSWQGFSPQLSVPNFVAAGGSLESSSTPPASLVTLPLLPCSPSVPVVSNQVTVPALSCLESCGGQKVIDLNAVAEIPEEKDLLKQLQGPPTTSSVIAPQPIRPVGSSISVGCINEDPSGLITPMQVPKKPEEVEEEVESEALPAVVSDSNNKVRLANSAYKEMVGQPECQWLDSMVTGEGRVGSNKYSCKRICGEVMLHLSDFRVPVKSKGFSCWVRIEWANEGKKSSIKAFCDVIRLSCQSKDYLFTWRFHTHKGSISI